MDEAGPSSPKRAKSGTEEDEVTEIDVSDVIDLEILRKQSTKAVSKKKVGKKWKNKLPKLVGKNKENYHLWLNGITAEERKHIRHVIRGQPTDTSDVIEDIPGNIKAGPTYNSIPNWKYEAYKRQYRPMNSRFIDLITKSVEEAESLDYSDRINLKMGLYQLLNNLNFVSARYQLSGVRGKLPTSRIKNLLTKFYH